METYSKLKEELEELGYTQTLKPECVPLVKKLLSDLKTTTENLRKYMKISQQAIEERDYLELGAEPYKCDNAKLIRECNELHLAFIHFKEQHEKALKDLKTHNAILENQLTDKSLEKENLCKVIEDLEKQLLVSGKKGEKGKPHIATEKGTTFQLNSAMASADQKVAFLNKEIRKLKDEQLQFIKSVDVHKMQLKNRDEEIKRLTSLLEVGRPPKVVSEECCYKNVDNKIGALEDEINALKREKNSLHNQLKEALAKQHEAMRRALHLADRNKQLEKEMKDIDQIALAVESECNNKVRSNTEKVSRFQDRLNESVISIQNLERDITKIKQEKTELSSDLDAVRLEKKRLQDLLETEVEQKKRLTDRINNFAIIERDLNLEIDRLVRLSAEQKRKIAELECQVTEEKIHRTSLDAFKTAEISHQPTISSKKNQTTETERAKSPTKSGKFAPVPQKGSKFSKRIEHKKTCKKSSSVKQSFVSKLAEEEPQSLKADFASNIGKCCCEAGGCVKSMKELLDKEMGYRQVQAMQQIESLKQEKDYYMKEYHKLANELRNVPASDKPEMLKEQYEELLKTIGEKNKLISDLQNEVRTLTQEQYSALRKDRDMERKTCDDALDVPCQNINCKRKCRELEILREELKYLEKENNSLKEKIQALNDSTVFDQERMKKAFQEMEQHIRKLEDERRDLVVTQCTSRSNMSQLEEECNMLREHLRTTQNELNNQKASYTQLRNLHDQAAKALSDTQSQLLRAETELNNLKSRMQNSQRESSTNEKEISKLQSDVDILKGQLTKMDKEKDDLLNVVDEKTEKIDQLENQLRAKKNAIGDLEHELKELKRKLSKTSEECASHELQLRSSKQEIAMLEKDTENERKIKESALQENRRLQNDLASVTCDCKEARKELEISKRQVDDLKTQLQHYVAEVKRAEDLMSQKELERTEILDHFKCLSEEANALENNNHTLENEATQSRVQLSVALDHASDLEAKLENQDAVIRSYEKQIAELTSQIASLEIQIKQGGSQQDRVITELKQMKDLCVKLDQEKDEIRRELRSKDDRKGVVDREIDELTKENRELRRALDKDQNSLDGLEKLLAEARQDVIDQRLLNQELQSEIGKLKAKIEELQGKLATSSEQLYLYQEKALEYNQQNKQLRREVANERFNRARDTEDKRYPSL